MDYKNPIYNKWISVLLIPRSLILLFVYYFTTMTAIQYYSLEEISKNNGKINSKIWIVIKNNVYDITNYMDKHPGGRSTLEEWAGKDGTKAFEDFGHSGDADNEMKKFKIGELAIEDRQNNGKKKAENVDNSKDKNRSFLSCITCGLLG